MRLSALVLSLIALAAAPPAWARQQETDPAFRPSVARPAWTANAPVVVIDGAHNNFHTVDGRYAPFAALLRADGLEVRGGTAAFDAGGLDGVGVLVIANAGRSRSGGSPFSASEIDAVEYWVRRGGNLLLIADHAPFGRAAADLAARFGVGMGQGWTFEPSNNEEGLTSQLTFSPEGGRLGDHPITRGRNADEAIAVVTTFTGQSLIPPEGASVLMRLGPQAWEAATDDAPAVAEAIRLGRSDNPAVRSAAGRAQGLAFIHGEGRVVVLGEAGMLSAQRLRFQDGRPDLLFGMNVAPENQQFGLNIVRWLTGVLP